MEKNLPDRIAAKIVMMLVFFSLLLTIVMTIAQLRADYRNEHGLVRSAMEGAVRRHRMELSRFAADGNARAIERVLYHLEADTTIDYASISVEGKVRYDQGQKNPAGQITLTYPIAAGEISGPEIGTLKVAANLQPIQDKLRKRFLKILVHNAIYIFLTAGFVFLMLHFMFTRHLEKLVEQVEALDPAKPYSPILLTGKKAGSTDELTRVVDGVNVMLKKAYETYESLARNEERLRLFLDSTQQAMIGIDRSGRCTFANNACRKLLNTEEGEELTGKNVEQLFLHPSTDSEEWGFLLAGLSMEKGEPFEAGHSRIITPDGKVIYVSMKAYPVFKDKEVTGAVVFIVDDTTEHQLRHRNELLNTALGQIPVMLIITDLENRVQYVNPGTERWLGFSREEMTGKTMLGIYELMEAENSFDFKEVEKALARGESWSGIVEGKTRTRSSLLFFTMFFPVYDKEGNHVNTISLSREVSHEIKLQNEMVNAKKMEAVVRLSSNLTHEFGNPLFGVSAVLKDVKERESLDPKDAELLNLAFSECERLRRLVREFQNLYKGSTHEEADKSVADVIKTVLLEAGPVMQAYGIHPRIELVDAAGEMVVSGSRLSMVLNNVMINAIESMTGTGGELVITTGMDTQFLKITVSDTGVGVKQEYEELIFEPFFSTKPLVEGAGLGLSIAYGTMKSMGGSISFESREEEGSSFHILVPLT
jgi:PAS domain S-box-containing protein